MKHVSQATTALLLIAHGSRNADANADLVEVARTLSQRGPYSIVEPAYLEIATPSIPEGAATCLRRGAQRVILLPFFLSPGVHARQDLQRYREELAQERPDIDFLLAGPLGRHPLLVEILMNRAQETLESGEP